jgi:drug/metabolite transporter (DMT)-like permease
MIFVFLAFLMTISGSLGAFCFRQTTRNGLVIKKIVFNKWLYLGGFLYIASLVCNIFLLRIADYSTVYPLGALTYIWTLLISALFLHEKITIPKIFALILIITGLYFVFKGN